MRHLFSVSVLLTVLYSVGYSQDTAHVKAGWNIIGSVKAGAVPEVLYTIPDSLITSSYWGYTPGVGYESTDTLINGTGYWVKAKSDGLIVFNNAPPIDSCKSRAFIYEGRLYHTVLIGEQCWMAENLDVGVMVLRVTEQTDNDTIEKYCYDNDPLNCALHGGLYLWDEAMQYTVTPGVQGICPPGWHLPTREEFETLAISVNGDGNTLKAVGQGSFSGVGTNTSGFSSLLSGFAYAGIDGFNSMDLYTYFFSSTEYDASYASIMHLYHAQNDIFLFNSTKQNGDSIRCLED